MALSSWYAFDVVAALTLDADYVIGRHAQSVVTAWWLGCSRPVFGRAG
jgi:hypothetical protein